MKIEIKYSTSEGPHLINISHAEIQQMIKSQVLVITQPTPNPDKPEANKFEKKNDHESTKTEYCFISFFRVFVIVF